MKRKKMTHVILVNTMVKLIGYKIKSSYYWIKRKKISMFIDRVIHRKTYRELTVKYGLNASIIMRCVWEIHGILQEENTRRMRMYRESIEERTKQTEVDDSLLLCDSVVDVGTGVYWKSVEQLV